MLMETLTAVMMILAIIGAYSLGVYLPYRLTK